MLGNPDLPDDALALVAVFLGVTPARLERAAREGARRLPPLTVGECARLRERWGIPPPRRDS